MSDLKKYIEKRKGRDAKFSKKFEEGYGDFKIGVMFRMTREKAGMTQEQLAHKLHTKKSAISRIENHAQDIRLSTLQKIAMILGKKIHVVIQ
jgi:DNA-binding XRE family transcriptional regulator